MDVLDANLKVVLRGTSDSDVAPVAGIALEPDLLAELSPIVAVHDFAKSPVAAGLYGRLYAWRLTRIASTANFVLLLEASSMVRDAARVARRYALGVHEAELLRLTVGGYSPAEIARRLDTGDQTVHALRAALTRRLGCASLREVVEKVSGRVHDDGAIVLASFMDGSAKAN